MKKNENALKRKIEVGQFAELSACVTKQLPRDIDPDVAQGWINNPDALKRVLRGALCTPVKDCLTETIARLKAAGYLDTSFESKEVHSLIIRPLTKEQALDEYRNSGGRTWIWDELEKNMPYAVPTAGPLAVMIMNFGKGIGSDEALAEMDKLGVRPLTYEELIQYGIANPEHQKQKTLVGLGTKHTLDGNPGAPVLVVGGVERSLDARRWGSGWGGGVRFPVVRK